MSKNVFFFTQLESPTYDFADEVHFKQLIREKLAGNQEEMPRIKSKGSVLMELAHEMKLVKEEIANSKAGGSPSARGPSAPVHEARLLFYKSTSCLRRGIVCNFSRFCEMP